MKRMTKYITFFFLLCSLSAVQAQKTSQLKANHVQRIVEKEIDYESGLDTPRILQESVYDKEGRLVEFKDWSKDGKFKDWIKYTYSIDDLLLTELSLDYKGKTTEKIVYTYKDGMKVKKSTYDAKDRLVKEKRYEFSYFE